MKFAPRPTAEASDCVLAHSLKLPDGKLRKGTLLQSEHLARLAGAGIKQVTVAALEPGDLPEDEAAHAVAAALAGSRVRTNQARTGRCNLFASEAGVLQLDTAQIHAVNCIDEAITVATLTPDVMVLEAQMLATIKIIPYAVPRVKVQQCVAATAQPDSGSGSAAERALSIAPFHPSRIGMVQTQYDPSGEALLDKTRKVLEQRLINMRSQVVAERRCAHEPEAVHAAIEQLLPHSLDLLVLSGFSAVSDRADVLPDALCRAGGHIEHFGMPVEPGNLLLLGHLGEMPVIAMPGCARSMRFNGFDMVLQRLIAHLPISASDIMQMGVGGLLR